MLTSVAASAAQAGGAGQGVPWLNVGILLVVGLAAYPLLRRLRRSASAARRRRWAEEGLLPEERPDPDAKP